jgi:hypothetical protein
MAWFSEAARAWMFASLVPTGRTLSTADPKAVLSQSLRVPIRETIIWDARTMIAASALFGLLILFVIRYIRSPWRKLPPSPWRLPVLGNTRQAKLFTRVH